ncbi:MAG: hypothetical protein KC621_16225 [Myxococcales bacterium]|nr:hypothetical protein [Myxococcales bacterium]
MLPILAAHVAFAQEPAAGDYLNLSFTGDRETPSALERFQDASERAASPLVGGVSVGPGGDAAYSVGVTLPPARLAPNVTLAYSSSGGWERCGRGWSLDVGPTIRRPTGPEASLYPAGVPIRLVNGGGFSGALWYDDVTSTWSWSSDQPGTVLASYDDVTSRFTLEQDDVTWTFEPRQDVDWSSGEPDAWHVISAADTSGNRIDWTWGDPSHDGDVPMWIDYGGTNAGNHFIRVLFAWTPAPHLRWRATAGVISEIAEGLGAIKVLTNVDVSGLTDRYRYVLEYDEEQEMLLGVDQVAGADTRSVASFDYAPHRDQVYEEGPAPTQIGVQTSIANVEGHSVSETYSGLMDATGDGLPDLLSASGIGRMRLDHPYWLSDDVMDVVDRWWEGGGSHAIVGNGMVDRNETVVLSFTPGPDADEPVRGTYSTVRTIDLDGDGLLDRIAATAQPVDWTNSLNAPLRKWGHRSSHEHLDRQLGLPRWLGGRDQRDLALPLSEGQHETRPPRSRCMGLHRPRLRLLRGRHRRPVGRGWRWLGRHRRGYSGNDSVVPPDPRARSGLGDDLSW